jgi:bile acid-coenzyme A ligase
VKREHPGAGAAHDVDADPRALSPGARLSMLAREHGHETAITFVAPDGTERELRWAELDQRSNALARLLAERGLDENGSVLVALANVPEHFLATLAAWKLGACVLSVSPRVAAQERDDLLALARPALVIADWDEGASDRVISTAAVRASISRPTAPLPDRVPCPGKAIASGASTGRGKLIVDPRPRAFVPWSAGGTLGRIEGLRPHQVQLVAGPLYHDGPFFWSHHGLFEHHRLVVMERFDAALAVDLIERHRVQFACLVPTMMRRITRLPDIGARDLSSIEAVFHAAAPCPAWLKHAWFELIGPERVIEGYGSTEAVGETTIDGDEWLEHPGSVGRATGGSELRILDQAGRDLPAGSVGDIYMRPAGGVQTYGYIGAPPAASTPDGFVSVGDLGWVDEAGYLYIADRRTDMIVSGGANVFAAEVEAALAEHVDIDDVVAVGVPDPDWGRRVHAIIQPRDALAPPPVDALDRHCRQHLAAFKVPKSYEFMAELPRSEHGKIQRLALAEERASGCTPAMLRPGHA